MRFTIISWFSQSPQVCCIHLDDVTTAKEQQRQCVHYMQALGEED